MRFCRIFLQIFLVVSCSIALGLSLKCFTCSSPQECKKPQLLECSKLLANNTRAYLDAYHQGVNLNATSLYYECLYEELRVGSADVHYRGCTYDNINGCQLQLRPQFAAPSQRKCKQCRNKDACNSSGYARLEVMTISTATLVMLLCSYIWSI